MAVNPNKYSIYATRDAEKSNLNWGKVASDVSTTLSVIQADRQARKDKLDEATNTAIEHLSQVLDVKNSTASALLINGSDMSKKNLMIQTDMLKRGLITPKDYMLFLQEQKSGYTNLSTAVQNWDKWYQDAEKDLELDKNGNIIASEGQIYGNETLAAFGNLNNKQLWTNPNNGQLQLVEMGKDQFGNYTVMPDPDKNPEKFLNPNSMNVRMTFKEKRKVLNLEAENQVSQIASFIESGVYDGIITNTASFRDAFDELEIGKDELGGRLTYDKWLDIQVESLTATPNDMMQILMEYKRGYHIAQTEEEFKEKYCKEGKTCDTLKMIQARYEDGRLVYNNIIGSDQEKEAKRLARIAIEVQIGREIRKSGRVDEETQFEYLKGKEDKKKIGYLTRVQDIVLGDLSAFSSASARGIQDMNRDAEGNMKTNPNEMIDNIKRVGDKIVITYQSGRPETINRKDDDGKIRTTKDIMGELFQLLTPYSDSYEDILELYTTGPNAKTINVSARDMDNAEISGMLKNNAASEALIAANEAKKGTSDYKEDYNPTPKEIEAASKGITITSDQILEAKKKGIPQTYVGADAIAYSSRTPYKIKSAGDAIIRGQGDTIPSITGEDALREGIRPTTPGETPATTLRLVWWTENRKEEVDGTLNKVFKAYLPSSVVRSKSKIEYNDKTEMLDITYKGKKLSIPGVTNVVINMNTTFTKLDKTIAQGAKYITEERNREFIRRKGGKPPAY